MPHASNSHVPLDIIARSLEAAFADLKRPLPLAEAMERTRALGITVLDTLEELASRSFLSLGAAMAWRAPSEEKRELGFFVSYLGALIGLRVCRESGRVTTVLVGPDDGARFSVDMDAAPTRPFSLISATASQG